MKNELSKKNPYWIPKHRYLELKNWCLQYPRWVEDYKNLSYITSRVASVEKFAKPIADPTAGLVFHMTAIENRIKQIEDTCKEVAPVFYIDLFTHVTTGITYDQIILANPDLPSRSEWYKTRRRFFYILSQKRE